MNIRKAEVSDTSELVTLVSSLSHFYLGDKSTSLPLWFLKTLEACEFEKRLSSTKYSNFVYLVKNKVIGYISITEENHLYHLFVNEAHQGRGISRKLWHYAISDRTTSRYTVRSSINAIPIYKSFGFKESEASASKDGIDFQPMVLEI